MSKDEMIHFLKFFAKTRIWSDDDSAITAPAREQNNVDVAYFSGYEEGTVVLARQVLKSFGLDSDEGR